MTIVTMEQRHLFAPGTRNRLTEHDLGRFSGATLFDRVGRALCAARCLPRKELYEAWEVARRARRLFKGGRVIDLAAGHGLLAHLMLLLDASSPSAVAVDTQAPASAEKIQEALVAAWPHLANRVQFITTDLEAFELMSTDVVVSSHACGDLTDRILARAATVGARVAVLPCCHELAREGDPLSGWLDGSLAMDVRRAVTLEAAGYRVWTQTIPAAITPKNRLLLAAPMDAAPRVPATYRSSSD
jgi:SAM-dependent methyltransferase